MIQNIGPFFEVLSSVFAVIYSIFSQYLEAVKATLALGRNYRDKSLIFNSKQLSYIDKINKANNFRRCNYWGQEKAFHH